MASIGQPALFSPEDFERGRRGYRMLATIREPRVPVRIHLSFPKHVTVLSGSLSYVSAPESCDDYLVVVAHARDTVLALDHHFPPWPSP